jgi:hypothetical protein
MKSIVRRDTQESYTGYLQRLAAAEGIAAEDAAALRRMDRKRSQKMSNHEWINPNDPEAEITRLKDGRAALAYKAEEAVDMQTGAIVAVTTHGAAAADTETIPETVCEAGVAVAELIREKTPQGEYKVHPEALRKWSPTRGITATMRCGNCAQLQYGLTSPNRNGADGTGKGGRRRKMLCMRTGGGSRASGASTCRRAAGSGSSATSRTSSIPAAWIGCMCAVVGTFTTNC